MTSLPSTKALLEPVVRRIQASLPQGFGEMVTTMGRRSSNEGTVTTREALRTTFIEATSVPMDTRWYLPGHREPVHAQALMNHDRQGRLTAGNHHGVLLGIPEPKGAGASFFGEQLPQFRVNLDGEVHTRNPSIADLAALSKMSTTPRGPLSQAEIDEFVRSLEIPDTLTQESAGHVFKLAKARGILGNDGELKVDLRPGKKIPVTAGLLPGEAMSRDVQMGFVVVEQTGHTGIITSPGKRTAQLQVMDYDRDPTFTIVKSRSPLQSPKLIAPEGHSLGDLARLHKLRDPLKAQNQKTKTKTSKS